MAMNKDTLGTAIKNFCDGLSDAQKNDIEYVWRGIANEIIEHMKTNAVVTVGSDTGTIE